MKITTGHTSFNWAKNIAFRSAAYAQPETEAELIELVMKYQKIRVVGTGHSWSALCCSEELLINLDRMDKILSMDRTAKTVSVQAGIKLKNLNRLLDREGLALVNLGSISEQSLAGAITTGTHGSGIKFQCLASQVLAFGLITANGEKRICKKGDDLFDAALISLGCLGIITEMTLQVTDAFNLQEITYTRKFSEVIEHIDDYIDTNDHFKLWWLPCSEDVVVFTYRRTQAARNDSRLRQFFNDYVLSVAGFRLLVRVGNLVNRWRNPINRYLTRQMKGPLDRIEKSYLVFNVPEPPKHRETEWAFDRKNAQLLLTAYRDLFLSNTFTFNFIQEIRFTRGDDFWLSECYGRDTIWIGAYNHLDKQWDGILDGFERFAKVHQGRPHWGKEFCVRQEYLAAQYPKYESFKAIRREMDPGAKFSNALIRELFD